MKKFISKQTCSSLKEGQVLTITNLSITQEQAPPFYSKAVISFKECEQSLTLIKKNSHELLAEIMNRLFFSEVDPREYSHSN